jgi:phosphohistidine phosphatase
MKTLLLLRHAKSSWDDSSLKDYDRPLSHRGERAAPVMGAYLRDEDLIPDVVLCSPALRARQTWESVEMALDMDIPIQFLDELYHATATMIHRTIQRISPDVETVLLVGHNPGFADVARWLVSEGDPEEMERMRFKYPTAGLAVVDFDVARWDDIDEGTGSLRVFIRPKDLR